MIQLNTLADCNISDFSMTTLKDRYLLPTESSPQEAYARVATAFSDSPAMAQRIYDYVAKNWMMFSSPVLSNGGTDRGMPASCFLSEVSDSIKGIIYHHAENSWLTISGGGIGTGWSSVRSEGTKVRSTGATPGLIPFIGVVDRQMLAFSQAENRRGSYAAYLNISHPEIVQFLEIRKPTGGDPNRKCLNLHHGVVIPDAFMELIQKKADNPDIADSEIMWDLIDPHSKEVTESVPATMLWNRILQLRVETGEPYIMFYDTVNKAIPEVHKKLNLLINNSNLCTETLLPANADRTAVCMLSSVNLETYDEWKDNSLFIYDMVRFLDNSLDYFIANAPEAMSKAVYSASQERSIGLGAMGLHSYFQKNTIAFDSDKARAINHDMFSNIWKKAEAASRELGVEKGFAPDYATVASELPQHELRRNVYIMAVAPNASSSILAGSSPGIEPIVANVYNQKTLSGTFTVKNKELDKILSKLPKFTYENVWKSIFENKGSVLHLKGVGILSDAEIEAFKTAKEINQKSIINMAADRQKFIDQGQSVNLFFSLPINGREFSKLHLRAWKMGLKTLYYVRSEESTRAEILGDVERVKIEEDLPMRNTAISCLGCD